MLRKWRVVRHSVRTFVHACPLSQSATHERNVFALLNITENRQTLTTACPGMHTFDVVVLMVSVAVMLSDRQEIVVYF